MEIISTQVQNLRERQLVNSFLIRRDEKAFRKLYHACTPRLYQLALRLLAGDERDAEEVIQDTWVRCVQNLAGFRRQSSFRTWLTGIAINRCREQLRQREKRNEQLQLDEMQLVNPDSGRNIDSLDLERAVFELPEGYRQVLVLHDIEGYKHSEIAQLLNIDTGTSKSQLFHARRALRQLLYTDKETKKE